MQCLAFMKMAGRISLMEVLQSAEDTLKEICKQEREEKLTMMIELIGKTTTFTAWLNETNNHVTIYNQYYDVIDEGILIVDEVITTKLGVLTLASKFRFFPTKIPQKFFHEKY